MYCYVFNYSEDKEVMMEMDDTDRQEDDKICSVCCYDSLTNILCIYMHTVYHTMKYFFVWFCLKVTKITFIF